MGVGDNGGGVGDNNGGVGGEDVITLELVVMNEELAL